MNAPPANHIEPIPARPKIIGLLLVWFSLILFQNFGGTLIQAQTPSPGVRYLSTNLQAFGIPFQIDAAEDSYIEVQLYLSRDKGKTWRLQDRQTTDQSEFRFQAQGDGEYWFGLKTLNRNRQLVPPGTVTPGLVVVVDTVDPQLEFQVSADAAGRVECRWRASDQNIDPGSLKIEYQSLTAFESENESWMAVPVQLKGTARNGVYADQIAWWPETTDRSLRVRLSIADKAGNRVQQERSINLAPTPWRHRNQATTIIAPENPTVRESTLPDARSLGQRAMRETTLDLSQLPNPVGNRSGISGGSKVWSSEPEHWEQPQQAASGTVRSPTVNPEFAPLSTSSNRDRIETHDDQQAQLPPANPAVNRSHQDHVISESSTAGPVNQFRGPSPQMAMANPPGFTSGALLPSGDFDESANWIDDSAAAEDKPKTSSVETSSPGGEVSAVPRLEASVAEPNAASDRLAFEPPITKRDPVARPSSQRSIVDSDSAPLSDARVQMISSKRFRLNYGIDAIDPSGVARVDLWMTRDDGRSWTSWGSDPDNVSPFPVEVEEEGRYGFRIVVHSKDGLTGRGPSSGDKPDIIVQIDTQAPMVQILSVPYGRGAEAGRLVINYRVADPHLTLRPVSIYYSSTPDGPWQPIEEGLRNEGRYAWKPNTAVPDRIYLRLEAVDRAGNRGIHQLKQAIDVSGLVPRGTIHGVVPVGSN